MNNYRKLTADEVERLEANGCKAEDWSLVDVADGFDAAYVWDSEFSGRVCIGSLEHIFELPGGIRRHSGIFRASLHNVTLGDGCYIRNIHNYIANYSIGDRCYIENAGIIVVDRESCFGNGVRVSVLNETGGREVVIFDSLSSHMAYMVALYRHRPDFIRQTEALIAGYVDSVRSSVGTIGNDVRIVNTGYLSCLRIGDSAHIEGASKLTNGTIVSKRESPVYIGNGVICEDFIVCSDSRITDGVTMSRCFVGQACRFGHNYSASDSLFFCNCQGENGEACSVFAGPYTVTHHKSTLLIAGMFSFMNAGSGSNQSNHMYKLGPIHQGTLERGAKTASDSYILWPSRVGAFSLVMGRHVTHSDTTNLPFSYLIEKDDATYLVPGVNLKSVGTIRDALKWPKRDARHDSDKLDRVNFNLLSPFTVHKMMKGLKTLENLRYSSGELSDIYSFHSTKITNSALSKGISYYRTAIDKFMGNSLISRLGCASGDVHIASDEQLRDVLGIDEKAEIGGGEWVDVSGLIAPKSEISTLMEAVESGAVKTLDEVNEAFETMARNYYDYEWTWAYSHFEDIYGIDPRQITRQQAIELILRWRDAVTGLDKLIYEDARKEFNLASMTGYGADGDRLQKEQDFENVRGVFESNSFVASILNHVRVKSELCDRAIAALK